MDLRPESPWAAERGVHMRILCLVAVAAASLVSGCDSGAKKPTEKVAVAPDLSSNAVPKAGTGATSDKIEIVKEEAARDQLTGPQNNAARSAQQYLSMTGFSRAGLIEQLSSDAGDGYSVADATAAVDSLNADWNENAARSAKAYLDMTGFSCNGLIEQLSSSAGDRYTKSQATYGARQAGAC
jgi:hypothetical protein